MGTPHRFDRIAGHGFADSGIARLARDSGMGFAFERSVVGSSDAGAFRWRLSEGLVTLEVSSNGMGVSADGLVVHRPIRTDARRHHEAGGNADRGDRW
jgi:hypothetical protein